MTKYVSPAKERRAKSKSHNGLLFLFINLFYHKTYYRPIDKN